MLNDFQFTWGRCCACGELITDDKAGALINLPFRLEGAGARGWGCDVCGLPAVGAQSVLCAGCFMAGAAARWVIYGPPWRGERQLITSLPRERFVHNLTKHQAEIYGL